MPNLGDTSAAVIISQMTTIMARNNMTYSVNTFGFGSDHDSSMLSQIAFAGNGTYYYIADETDIGTTFSDCLGGLLSVVGQKMQLKVETSSYVEILDVLGGAKVNNISNGVSTISILNLQRSEEREVILKIRVAGVSGPQVQDLLSINLDYFNVVNNKPVTKAMKVHLPRGASGIPLKRNKRVDMSLNRITAAMALNKATKCSLVEAKTLLQQAIDEISKSESAAEKLSLLLTEDLKRAGLALSGSNSKHLLFNQYQSHFYQVGKIHIINTLSSNHCL